MGQIKAGLCGYYGKGNGGDEALLASVLQMLPENVTPLVLSGNPKETRDRYQVESCDRMDAMQVWQALRSCDALIMGGGSLMQDATSLRNPIYYGGLMGMAERLGLKTIALAQGIGPLNSPVTNWVAKRAFGGCAAITVRDRASAFLLQEWGISCMMAPDPVWNLEPSPVENLWDLPAPRVAVALRSHPQLTPERIDCLTRALVDFQTATQTCILLVPFQPASDLALAQSIQAQLRGANHIFCLEDPRKLKGLFQGVEMTIGMRYHALIMAAAHECKCFAISYDPKVSQLMEEINMPGWELEQIPHDPKEITQTWLEHYANGDPLNTAQIQALVDRSLIHRDLLVAALGK